MNSQFFSLDIYDIGKGFLMAFLGAFLPALYEYLKVGWGAIDWKFCLAAGISAGIAYLLKNFFTNSENKLLRLEKRRLA